MRKTSVNIFLACILAFVSCEDTHVKTIPNPFKGVLRSTVELSMCGEKVFALDSVSAPSPAYVQFLTLNGRRTLSYLNRYMSSIYLYDYDSGEFISRNSFKQPIEDEIRNPGGYFILNADSVYILDMAKMNLDLVNLTTGHLVGVSSLKGNEGRKWPMKYPQYNLSGSNPMWNIGDDIILTGQLFWSIPSDDIDKFHFSTHVNKSSGYVSFHDCYPKEVYGEGYNWDGGLQTGPSMTVTPDRKFAYSFPPSHDIYLYDSESGDYEYVYGGSNFADVISSIDCKDKKKTPRDDMFLNYIRQDMYGPIIYDPYKEIYYRFLFRKISDDKHNSIQDKDINIVIMDKDFGYLGETCIGNGKEWNAKNAYVTEEGLNIEYFAPNDFSEDNLRFKIFNTKLL